ncbi:hypothetical protein GCM10007860_00630 [Chitiniphilus shinanonensis]|uniref:Uncharacterized protein n=1 Tax=Chitiniphilus shinanonensis TaxID=553088 RepID=A0ABQ6BLN4_9NEIS|nr:hypothetical protein [Chitiniphilus shinanonensis]GLS02920.1 hypothetical protein GCM10007860_00630 [Chitiniphilus shinanonensis]
MYSFFASLFHMVRGNHHQITVNDRVNRVAGFDGRERYDGRVLKVVGHRARVCWPEGQKTEEELDSLVQIVD